MACYVYPDSYSSTINDILFGFSGSYPDPTIDRNYDYMSTDDKTSLLMYGGANESAVEFDDPMPIFGRGYWFDGEHHFITFRNLKWSLSPMIAAWVKVHNYDGTLFTASNEDAGLEA
jgi:hypothetical protein